MFESNFPVDKGMCSYLVLWNALKRLAAGASAEEKAALFSGTTTRVYHTTSDEDRAGQVLQGQGLTWNAKQSFDCDSKWTAAAIEAVAHALLQDSADKYSTKKVNKKGKVKRSWGFTCSWEEAGKAVEKAKGIVLASLTMAK
jgi:hypothetical protein